MKLSIVCVGKLRASPESEIFQNYILRFHKLSKQLNFKFNKLIEIDNKKFRDKSDQAKMIGAAIPRGAFKILLDEKGENIDSVSFANLIMRLRDEGQDHLVFSIGGADGVTKKVEDEADKIISFGKMVWPHALVRIMLIEQLYRSASILTSKPYHRI